MRKRERKKGERKREREREENKVATRRNRFFQGLISNRHFKDTVS